MTTLLIKIQRVFQVILGGLLAAGLLAAGLISTPLQADGQSEYYRTITLNSGQVAGALSDFPLLVSFSGDALLKDKANGGHVANSDGRDIYFTDQNGSNLSYEIEKYDNTTGALVAWVKVPSLTDGAEIKLFYGGSGITSNSQSDVWSNGFKGVWHLDQNNSSDSTGNSNNATATSPNVTVSASGLIGGAVRLDGTDGYIDCGSGPSLDFYGGGKYTWLVWVNTSATGGVQGGQGIVGKSTAGAGGYESYIKNGDNLLSFQMVPAVAAAAVGTVEVEPGPGRWQIKPRRPISGSKSGWSTTTGLSHFICRARKWGRYFCQSVK